VLDWNLWSRQRRRLWRDRAAGAGYRAVLYYLRVPVETAIERAERRRRSGVRYAHVLDAAAITQMGRIFEPPGPDEGLDVIPIES
jgi:predicted kinase